jgi:hypothetical protein
MSAISPKADVVENKGYVSALCQKQTLPQPQSNTSSARCCRSTGASNPSPFAVLRLIDITNFVGNCTGNSAGLVPLSSEHRRLYVVGQPQSQKVTLKNVTTRPFAIAPN